MSTEELKKTEAPLPEDYKPLSTGLKFFFGVGDFGFNLMNSVENYYFVFFLTNCAMFDPAVAAMVATVGSTIDAIVGWMYGGFLNAIKPQKWGRYRSWLLWMPWLVPIFFALGYTRLVENTTLAAVLVAFFYITSHLCWDFPYVSNVTMISRVGKRPEDRARLSATRGMWSNGSKIVFSYLFPPVAMVGATLFGETGQYAFAALVFACVMAAGYNIHFLLFKGYEREYTAEELKNWKSEKKGDKDQNSIPDMMRALFQNPHLICLVFSDISKWVYNFVIGGTAVYYFTYVVFEPATLATYIFISNILCVVGSFLSAPLAKLLKGARNACIISFALMAACLIIARTQSYNMWMVVILLSIAQLGYGCIYSAIVTLYSDCVIFSEWKTGKNSAGWISGLQLLPLKIGFIARGVIIPAILSAAGFVAGMDPSQATESLQTGIVNGFLVLPTVLLIVSILLLLFGYRLNNTTLAKYSAELAARKEAAETIEQAEVLEASEHVVLEDGADVKVQEDYVVCPDCGKKIVLDARAAIKH